MQRDKVLIYVHFISATWDRLPLIPLDKEQALHNCLASVATRLGSHVVAVNGMPDHVHMLLSLPSTLSVSELAQQLKGNSSYFANHEMNLQATFKWRGAYAAYSVSRWDVPKIARYIQSQKQHHGDGTLIPRFEPDDL